MKGLNFKKTELRFWLTNDSFISDSSILNYRYITLLLKSRDLKMIKSPVPAKSISDISVTQFSCTQFKFEKIPSWNAAMFLQSYLTLKW